MLLKHFAVMALVAGAPAWAQGGSIPHTESNRVGNASTWATMLADLAKPSRTSSGEPAGCSMTLPVKAGPDGLEEKTLVRGCNKRCTFR